MTDANQTQTRIAQINPNNVLVRGYRLADLVNKVSFTEAIHLIIQGELPDQKTKRILDAILVAAIDHGVTPPSTLAARTAVSTGAAYNAALATAVLSINQFHGGAIENCARLLKQLVEDKRNGGDGTALAAETVKSFREKGKRLPGFGHRVHTADPRVSVLKIIAQENGLDGEYLQIGFALEAAVEEIIGKKLPMNVDGMMAALLCELDFPLELANMLFILARVPGWISHIYEEDRTQRKMRKINPDNHKYIGLPERDLNY